MAEEKRSHAGSVLITGAARGLGLAMAQQFLAEGYQVYATDILEEELAEAAEALQQTHGDDAVGWSVADVTDDTSIAQLLAHVAEWSAGSLEVLVNNAGVITRNPTEELDTAVWARELEVNLGGALRCCREAHPLLVASEYSSVVNLGSLGSSLGMPQRAAYNSAKTAIVGLTRTLAAEWGPHGIRVNAIAPGFIDTVMMRSGLDRGLLDEQLMMRRIPLRRLGQAAEIADAAVFLASARASYINGVCLPVDGGTIVDGTFFDSPPPREGPAS